MDGGSEPDIAAILGMFAAPGSPAEMLELVRRLGASSPLRSQAAGIAVLSLLCAESGFAFQPWLDQAATIEQLIGVADEYPPTLPFWPQGRALAALTLRMGESLKHGETPDLGGLITAFSELPPGGLIGTAELDAIQATFAHARAGLAGEDSALGRTRSDFSLLDMPGADSLSGRLTHEIMRENQALEVADVQGDEASARELRARIRARPGPLSRPGLDLDDPAVWVLAVARASQASLVGGEDGPPVLEPAELDLLARLAVRTDPPPAHRAILHLAIGQEQLRHAEGKEVRRIEEAISHFEEVPRLAGPGDPSRLRSLIWLAAAVLQHVEATADIRLLAEAASALDEARRTAGGPTHPQWSIINSLLSKVDDRRGRPAAYLTAADSLRQQVWQVLLQDDPGVARTAARLAARYSLATADRCLTGNDPDAAIRALESGRGLMLFAAAQFSEVAPRLEAAGRADLAGRWRRRAASGEPDRPSDPLRREVLSVIAETTDALDSPSPAEIADALRTLDADALVYLVPATEHSGGYAVIAPARGSTAYMMLGKGLRVAGARRFDQYLSTLSRESGDSRDLAPDRRRAELATSLDAICAWAWETAVGPLLDDYISTLPRPAGGRPCRIYLIPVGELALVPWHAAKRPGGDYALSEAAFSTVGSARMLCRAARLAPVRPGPVALVVGDPDTGGAAGPLLAARAEAYAVHQAYYRAGRYVGTRPNGTPSRSGAGSARQVREWLADAESDAGGVLHLACHGFVETEFGAADSRLVLADGEPLAADEIVPLLTRSGDRQAALVVLAACRTGVSAYGYDEAYSLGTAFLTGGIRTVLSTQWSVPDQETSVMMFMFHHFLMGHRLPAWEALRRAQLWMLDPDRSPPAAMPSALRARVDSAGAALSRAEAWAGFVHLGQ